MGDEIYQPSLSPEEAQKYLDSAYNSQIDAIPRPDLGEDGPRRIPLTPGRQAALAVFKALGGRRGCDLREQGIDAEILGEIVDEATDIINQAFNLGEGPISVGVAHHINQIHSEGYTWQVGYSAEHKEYCVLHFNDTTPERADSPGAGYSTDSLFEAIRTAQKSMKEAKND